MLRSPSAESLFQDITGYGQAIPDRLAQAHATLAALCAETRHSLTRDGRLRGGAPATDTLAIPEGIAGMLAAALVEADRSGEAGSRVAQILEQHYLRFLPRLRLEQRLLAGGAEERVLHTPLKWERLPRLRRALGKLESLFRLAWPGGRAPAGFFFGTDSAGQLLEACPTVGELYERAYYGDYLPLLCGFPSDLARIDQQVGRGAQLEGAIEEHLTAPLIHELSHAGRARQALLPPYLDECIASYLGVLALDELAFPAAGAAAPLRALYATPWLMQVGQALARLFGLQALVQAQLGVRGFAEVLPAGLPLAAATLGWREYLRRHDPHFLSSNFSPQPWLKLVFLAAAGRLPRTDELSLDALSGLPWAGVPVPEESELDAEILSDALRTMCLHTESRDGAFSVWMAAPLEPIAVDLQRCTVETAADGVAPTPRSYLFPPSLAARLRGQGLSGYSIAFPQAPAAALPASLAAVATLIRAGAPSKTTSSYILMRHGDRTPASAVGGSR